jgi:hypothetical protein
VSILKDFPASDSGSSILPNLLAGGRQEIGLTFRALAGFSGKSGDNVEVCAARLEWTDPESGGRMETRLSLQLPVLGMADWDALPINAGVVESMALLRVARAKREAMRCIDLGDEAGVAAALAKAGSALAGLAESPRLASERVSMASLQRDLDEGSS